MATTLLRSLEIEGFKSFANKATVEFPRSGLVLIRGTRTDGISSGTGKTTLLNAITHALKHCPEAGTEIQSWLTDKPARVALGLEQDGNAVELIRGSKSSLKIGDAKSITGAAAIDSHLEKLIGLPPELLAALTFRPQKSPGLFLSKSDSDKKSFLSLVLGLTSLEDEVEKSQERVKILEKELAALEVRRDAKSAEVQAEVARGPSRDELADVEALEKLLEPLRAQRDIAVYNYNQAKDTLQQHIEAVQDWHNKFKSECVVFEGMYRSELAALERDRPTFAPDTTELVKHTEMLQAVEQRLSARKEADANLRKEIQAQIKALNFEIFKLKGETEKLDKLHDKIAELRRQQNDANCPTCNQKWVKSNAEYNSFNTSVELIEQEIDLICNNALEIPMLVGYVKRHEEQLAAVDPLIVQLEQIKSDIKAKIADIQADMKVAETQFYADFNAKIADKKADIQNRRLKSAQIAQDYSAKQKIVEDAERVQAEALAKDMNSAANAILEMEGRIRTARATNKMKLDAIKAHDENMKALRTALDGLRGDVSAKAKEIAAERDFVKLVGREGFLGNIFSEVLVEIANDANRILKNVPNVSHVTIKFKNESVTQKGSVKKAITPVVSVGGIERPLGAALSGGMRTVVDLAVDLAARRVVSRRSGHNPAWLILDEPFEGLSAIEKECILEILKGFAQEVLILVVDHATETKESFTQVIEVVNHNGRSTIKEN